MIYKSVSSKKEEMTDLYQYCMITFPKLFFFLNDRSRECLFFLQPEMSTIECLIII